MERNRERVGGVHVRMDRRGKLRVRALRVDKPVWDRELWSVFMDAWRERVRDGRWVRGVVIEAECRKGALERVDIVIRAEIVGRK
jgi:hypothetical protein